MTETGDKFTPGFSSTSRRRTMPIALPYSYTPDSADSVSAIVVAAARAPARSSSLP